MIEEISEVNSRKGGNPTPGGSQKPRVAGPGGGRKGGLSCTEARVTNLPHASGRTKDAGRVKQLRRRSERVTRESVVLRPLFCNSERYSRKIGGRIKHSEQNTVPPEGTERQGTFTALWPRFNTSPRREYSGEGAALRPLYRGAKVEPRIHNGNEGQVLYGIPLSNEQVFVGQWPKGQIKNARLITTTPPENTSPREYPGEGAHLSFRP